LLVSNNIIPLVVASGISPGQNYRRLLDYGNDDGNTTTAISPIKSVKDEVFMTTVKIGDQDFAMVIDVGSSDTWVAMKGFKCAERTGISATFLDWLLGKPKCLFGRTYEKTTNFSQVPDQHFSTAYADGEYARGLMGKETLTLSNLTIADQPMGFAQLASWTGDGVSSGILGLAFPSITNAYAGISFQKEKKLEGANIPYPPVFTNMYRKKLIKPYFSMALNRASEGPGALAFGGLPGPSFKHTGDFARAPLQQLVLKTKTPPPPMVEDGLNDYRFYAVNTGGFTVNSQPVLSQGGSMQVIIDSGSRLTHLPSKIVEAIAQKWQPPATYVTLTDEWTVDCAGKPPKVGVLFNGTTIFIDSGDLVLKVAGNMCISTIQKNPGGDDKGMFVLGAPFLRSVIAVFDVGASEMRFANRVR
jgi:hypothetical protein